MTGQQIAGAAAEADGAPSPGPTSGKGAAEGVSEDVRGPHAALAVKLQVITEDTYVSGAASFPPNNSVCRQMVPG